MEEKQQLNLEISELEAQIAPKRKRLGEIYAEEENSTKVRINKAERGQGDFTLDELRFAAHERCLCGAGMAYPIKTNLHGAWRCSNILRGKAERGSSHSSPMPFAFYEVKSEYQPSANAATTRPAEESEKHLNAHDSDVY